MMSCVILKSKVLRLMEGNVIVIEGYIIFGKSLESHCQQPFCGGLTYDGNLLKVGCGN